MQSFFFSCPGNSLKQQINLRCSPEINGIFFPSFAVLCEHKAAHLPIGPHGMKNTTQIEKRSNDKKNIHSKEHPYPFLLWSARYERTRAPVMQAHTPYPSTLHINQSQLNFSSNGQSQFS